MYTSFSSYCKPVDDETDKIDEVDSTSSSLTYNKTSQDAAIVFSADFFSGDDHCLFSKAFLFFLNIPTLQMIFVGEKLG